MPQDPLIHPAFGIFGTQTSFSDLARSQKVKNNVIFKISIVSNKRAEILCDTTCTDYSILLVSMTYILTL